MMGMSTLEVAAILVLICIVAIGSVFARSYLHREAVQRINGIAVPMCTYRFGAIVGVYARGDGFNRAMLEELSQLKSIEELQLDYTALHDKDLEILENFSNLKSLWLYDNEISDPGVAWISKVGSLEFVSLRLKSVSANGLMKLLRIPSLKEVQINGSMFESAEIDAIRQQYPKQVALIVTNEDSE